MALSPHRIAFSFLFGLVFLSASAVAEDGAEDVFAPSAGELVVGTTAEPGAKPEPVRFQYGYGAIDEKSGPTEALRGILGSLPAGESAHPVDVFAEDTPEGIAKGRRLAKRLRAIATKLWPVNGNSPARLEFAVVPVPPKASAPETLVKRIARSRVKIDAAEKTTGLGEAFRRALVRPSTHDIRTGVIVGAYRGITSFSTWFSTPGINPLLATGLASFQTALSTFHAAFARGITNVFSLNLRKPGAPIGRGTLFVRRQIYGILIGEIVRLMSGTPPGFDPIDSWAGQAQIVSFSLAISGLDALVMGARDRAFLNDPIHFARLYLANFFLLTPWQMLDSAGTFPVLLDLTVYKVRATTFGILGTYFGVYQALTRAPDKVAVALDAIFDPIDRVIGTVRRSVNRSCRTLFHAAEDFGDHFRDFVR